MKEFDLLIIGGGINGCGIARDAALRGLNVCLVEKEDFGSGTTSRSTRLIHGGLRYLEYFDFPLVFESLQDREILLKTAPHLVRPLSFIIPFYKYDKRGPLYINAGMIFYDLLSFNKSMLHYLPLTRRMINELEPGMQQEKLKGGVTYYDCTCGFPERLALENVIDAVSHGAVAKNHTEVASFIMKGKKVIGAEVKDRISGKESEIFAKLTINAAGTWVDKVLNLSGKRLRKRMGGTKGTHIIVENFTEAPRHAVYVETKKDGRPIFIWPWYNKQLIGTTDDHYNGSLDDVRPTKEEVDYLIDEINWLFPKAQLSERDVIHSYAGVRPLPNVESLKPGQLPRKHFIVDHDDEGVKNLISIVGGKITTYRNLSRQTIDLALKKLRKKFKATETKTRHLPGGNIADIRAYIISQRKKHYGNFDPNLIERLINLYGTRYIEVLKIAEKDRKLAENVCEHNKDIKAQIKYAMDNEMALSISDVLTRRTGIVVSRCQSRCCIGFTADALAKKFGWNEKEKSAAIKAYVLELDRLYSFQ
jgi:glycerol-3-phosphate dehydrogenase